MVIVIFLVTVIMCNSGKSGNSSIIGNSGIIGKSGILMVIVEGVVREW